MNTLLGAWEVEVPISPMFQKLLVQMLGLPWFAHLYYLCSELYFLLPWIWSFNCLLQMLRMAEAHEPFLWCVILSEDPEPSIMQFSLQGQYSWLGGALCPLTVHLQRSPEAPGWTYQIASGGLGSVSCGPEWGIHWVTPGHPHSKCLGPGRAGAGSSASHNSCFPVVWSRICFALSCSALAQQQISGLGVEGAPGGSESDWQHSSGAQGSVEAQRSYWLALLEGLWIWILGCWILVGW